MIVRALEGAKGDDVDKMISALEGWSFVGPKGQQPIRASDHAMIQPMFQVKLVKAANGKWQPKVIARDQGPVRRPAGEALAAIPDLGDRGAPPHRSSPRGTSGSTSAAHASSPMSRSRSARASSSGSSGRTAPARRRSSTCSRGSSARPRAASSCTAVTSRATPPYRRTRAGLGRTFQVSSVFPLLSRARERPPRGGGGARRHAADLAAGARSGEALERAERALERVGLARADPGPRACSRTATSASSSSRCCSPASRT